VYKGIKPTIAGSVGISQSETVTAVLVQMKLNGYACFVPGNDDAKPTP
jgi:hypothetical protein